MTSDPKEPTVFDLAAGPDTAPAAHHHEQKLNYTDKSKLLFKESLGFKYYDQDHLKSIRENGDKKWDTYLKNISEIFVRYDQGIHEFQKIIEKNLALDPPKPIKELEQRITNLAAEAEEQGWKKFVLKMSPGKFAQRYYLYEYGLEGLKKLQKELQHNAEAVKIIDRFIELKKKALENAAKGAVGDVLSTYKWREPTKAKPGSKETAESDQIQPTEKLLQKEKRGLLVAKIIDLAEEKGITRRLFARKFNVDQFVQDLQKRGVTDEQIKLTALHKLDELKQQSGWFFRRIYNNVVDFFGGDDRVEWTATESLDKGITIDEELKLEALAIEFSNNPGDKNLTRRIKDAAEAGEEPEIWLFAEEYLFSDGELKPDQDLAPKARAYKKAIEGWDRALTFKAFAKILPRRAPEKPVVMEASKPELSHAQKARLDTLASLFRRELPYDFARAILSSPEPWTRRFAQIASAAISYGEDLLIKDYLLSLDPQFKFAEFAVLIPDADTQNIMRRVISTAEKFPQSGNANVVTKLVDFFAGKKNNTNKKAVATALTGSDVAPALASLVQNIISPPAPVEIKAVTEIKPPPIAKKEAAKPPVLRSVPPPVVPVDAYKADVLARMGVSTPGAGTTIRSIDNAAAALRASLGHVAPPPALRKSPDIAPTSTASAPTTPKVDAHTRTIVDASGATMMAAGFAGNVATEALGKALGSARASHESVNPLTSTVEASPLFPIDDDAEIEALEEPVATTLKLEVDPVSVSEATSSATPLPPEKPKKEAGFSPEKIADELIKAGIFLVRELSDAEKEDLLKNDVVGKIIAASKKTRNQFIRDLPTAGEYLAKQLEKGNNQFTKEAWGSRKTKAGILDQTKQLRVLAKTATETGQETIAKARDLYKKIIVERDGLRQKQTESINKALKEAHIREKLDPNGYKIITEILDLADAGNDHDQEFLRLALVALSSKDIFQFETFEEFATPEVKGQVSEGPKTDKGKLITEGLREVFNKLVIEVLKEKPKA